MGQGLFKSIGRAVALLVIAVLLIACSPRLDWRTVQAPQERYVALFPGKPDKLNRRISFQGQEILQTLEAVKIDDDIYSISAIHLSANQSAMVSELLGQLQMNLLDRAKASGSQVLIEDSFFKTSERQRLPVKDYFLDLKLNSATQQLMRVRWIIRVASNGDSWIYQISILHTNTSADDAKALLSREEYENFFSGFTPE